MNHYQQLLNNFEKLGLDRIKEYFPNYLDIVNENEISFTEAMLELTNQEIAFKTTSKQRRSIEKANFPKVKRLSDFDFDFQPSINKRQIIDLEHMSFVDKNENIIFIGNPGVGKTHLAIGIGVAACEQGVRSFFINCHDLILKLNRAYEKGTLQRIMRRFANYPLLIIDEIGYLPIEHHEADLLFQLINMRYEKHSTIFTTNISLSAWAEVFKNPNATAAILDRLVHHSNVIRITGKSYRLKDYYNTQKGNP